MASNKHGFGNEYSIINYLNNKKFKELNDNMKNFLSWLFDFKINYDNIIYSGKVEKPSGERKNPKPDIWIKVNSSVKFISVKEGSGNSVHQEPFIEFCEFLTKIGVENDILNNLKFYHYGDDTIDGTGENRYSSAILKISYKNKIQSVNSKLNQNPYLDKILNRILFAGTLKNPINVDVCYHGDINNGIWASRDEILNYLSTNIPNEISGIIFSHLTYQPWTRDEHRTAKHPERRLVMQVKWGSMLKDFIKITERRNNDNK